MIALHISPKIESLDRPKNCKGLYGILQLLQGSHLDNFPLKTLKLSFSNISVEMFRFSI